MCWKSCCSSRVWVTYGWSVRVSMYFWPYDGPKKPALLLKHSNFTTCSADLDYSSTSALPGPIFHMNFFTVAKWKFFKMGHFKKHLSIGLNLPSLIKYKLDVSLWAALFLDFSVEVSFRESKGWPFRERAQMMFLWVKCSSFRVLGMLRGPLNLVHTFHAAQLPGKKWRSSSVVVLLTWCALI